MVVKKSRTEEKINIYLKQEYEVLEKKIRYLEKYLITNHESEIGVSMEIPFVTNQREINCIVDYIKNKIKPAFKKTILTINPTCFDERLLITITNDELQ